MSHLCCKCRYPHDFSQSTCKTCGHTICPSCGPVQKASLKGREDYGDLMGIDQMKGGGRDGGDKGKDLQEGGQVLL